MKRFNINECMYIQITDEGWEHLEKTVGVDYINACIKTPHYTHIINGETWYRLQCWSCFDLMPPSFGGRPFFNTNVMFDEVAAAVSTRFVLALETTDNIIKGKKYPLIDIDDSGLYYYIIDESGEETSYWHSVLNEC